MPTFFLSLVFSVFFFIDFVSLIIVRFLIGLDFETTTTTTTRTTANRRNVEKSFNIFVGLKKNYLNCSMTNKNSRKRNVMQETIIIYFLKKYTSRSLIFKKILNKCVHKRR